MYRESSSQQLPGTPPGPQLCPLPVGLPAPSALGFLGGSLPDPTLSGSSISRPQVPCWVKIPGSHSARPSLSPVCHDPPSGFCPRDFPGASDPVPRTGPTSSTPLVSPSKRCHLLSVHPTCVLAAKPWAHLLNFPFCPFSLLTSSPGLASPSLPWACPMDAGMTSPPWPTQVVG